MAKLEKIISKMRNSPSSISFADLSFVCLHYFGKPRNNSSSHHVYKTPWPGDPRVNIQKANSGKAKPYQVRQIIAAIDKLEEIKNG